MKSPIARREGLLTSAWYGALFFVFGAHLPYWPVWLADWGLSQAEIGTYMGLALVLRVVGSTALPALADRFAARRAVIAVSAALAAGVFFLHLFIEARPVLLAATLAAALVTAPLIPLGEALGVRAAAMHGFAYAHARAAGSLAFLAMNVGLGVLIARLGPGVVLWAVAVNFLAVAGDIPIAAGLSSSSALVVATIEAQLGCPGIGIAHETEGPIPPCAEESHE